MFLKVQNEKLKSANKNLRSKVRSLSAGKRAQSEDDSDLDPDDYLYVTSAVKKQVMNQ